MGDPRRLTSKAETPRKVWDAERIKNESQLKREYGLRRTRELWVTLAELKKVRRSARSLLSLGEEGREKGMQIISKLQRLGIAKAQTRLEDVLGLTVRDFLERRLQTLVFKKGLARTMRQARQLIVHGFISVGGRRVTIPSYMVTVSEEPTISYYKAIEIEPAKESEAAKSAAAKSKARAKMAAQASQQENAGEDEGRDEKDVNSQDEPDE